MADREKVIRGLELCAYDPDPGQELKEIRSCPECPYYRAGCSPQLIRDALALLKEQEPRVIELSEISPNIYVWMENRDDGTLFPLKGGVIDPDGDDYFRFDEGLGEDFVYYPTGSFGKCWRVWDKCPSPEQMRETKWEGEEIK